MRHVLKSRFLIILLGCSLSLYLAGCDFVYSLLQKKGAQEKALIGEVIPPESNAKVAEVQKLLNLYGYRAGKVDGVLGAKTRDALEKFQKDNDLEVSRFIDKETWEMLIIFKDYGLVIDGEINAAAVQRALKEAGFNPGRVDGKLGRRTQIAVKAFQQHAGLKADGKIGFKTLWELADYLPLREGY